MKTYAYFFCSCVALVGYLLAANAIFGSTLD